MTDIAKKPHISRNSAILIVGWVLLWVIPWGRWLNPTGNVFFVFVVDMFKLGVAFIAFLIPGILFFFLFSDLGLEKLKLSGVFPVGFALSVFLVSIIGLLGRLFGLSFQVVKYIFVLIGFFEMILFSFRRTERIVMENFFSNVLAGFRNLPLLLAFFMILLVAFNEHLFFIDDTTYLAYLTNWQHSQRLGFENIVHEIDKVEHFRFWLALFPMWQALLADVSGLSGLLLLGSYLEPYLVLLGLLTLYWFARFLGLSHVHAGFAALFQISIYLWMFGDALPVGSWFMFSMSEDKVAAVFLLAPAFFFFGLSFVEYPTGKNFLLVFFIGITLALAHAVILFYALFIMGCMLGFAVLSRKLPWGQFAKVIVIFVLILLPYLGIRIYAPYSQVSEIPYDGAAASKSFHIEKYTRVVNDVFYGLNPDVLKFVNLDFGDQTVNVPYQAFRLIPIFVILMATLLAITHFKNDPLHWYLLSVVLLVGIATIPYTGWLLGYFVSARLISRTSWFLPYGIGAVLLGQWISQKSRFFSRRTMIVGGLGSFVLVMPVLFFLYLPSIPQYFSILAHNKELVQVGAYIDQNTDNPVMAIALDYWDTQLLAGVSSQVRLISFREEKLYNPHNSFLTHDEIQDRIDTSNLVRSLDKGLSVERCAAIKDLHIEFIVTQPEQIDDYLEAIAECREIAKVVFISGDMQLIVMENADEGMPTE